MKRFVIVALVAVVISTASYADHSWNDYHWARKSDSFDLPIINSTTNDWDEFVAKAVKDWSASSVLNMVEEDGSTSSRTRRRCKPPGGKVRICNLGYGKNGWLGIAGISIDSADHILSGYTKLNDSYFNQEPYNHDNWKQSVTCQEIGHDFGLGHQDENFNVASSTSCMEYQSPPFENPDDHDFAQLEGIYDHIDAYNTYDGSVESGGGGGGCNAPPGKGCNKGETPGHNRDIGWGMSLGRRGQTETFMRIDPDGTRHVTHVTWAEGH
jgi:hypothetical protein